MEKWMGTHQNARYVDLVVPGTHNSATSATMLRKKVLHTDNNALLRVCGVLAPFKISPWVSCQNLKISEQLAIGVRYFDLRLCVTTDGTDTVVVAHSFACVPFAAVLHDVNVFLRENPSEVVWIDCRLDNNNKQSFKDKAHLFREAFEHEGVHELAARRDGDWKPWKDATLRDLTLTLKTPLIVTCHPYLLPPVFGFAAITTEEGVCWFNTAKRGELNRMFRQRINEDKATDSFRLSAPFNTPATRHVATDMVSFGIGATMVGVSLVLCLAYVAWYGSRVLTNLPSLLMFAVVLASTALLFLEPGGVPSSVLYIMEGVCIAALLALWSPSAKMKTIVVLAAVGGLVASIQGPLICRSVRHLCRHTKSDALKIIGESTSPNLNVVKCDYIDAAFAKQIVELNSP